jgi:anti-sigma regulatory factor (Ser/Thr protein kinase)/HAMP domain-containing protein
VGSINISDRPYFRLAVETGDLAVGEYQVGRISGTSSLNLGFPIRDEAGLMLGIVYAGLDLGWLNDLAAQANLPQGATLTLVDRQGTVLVRHPQPQNWVGRSLADDAIIQEIMQRGTGVSHAVGEDGISRLYTFAPIAEIGMAPGAYLSIGIPYRAAFQDADSMLVRNLIVLQLIGVLTFLVAWTGANWLILRRVNLLLRTARRLSKGDLSVRTGLPARGDELSQLAGGLDEMAASLERAQERLVETEKEKKEFYKEVVRVVTHDKFHLVDAPEIPLEGQLIVEAPLNEANDDRAFRSLVRQTALDAGLPRDETQSFLMAVGEAATNAVKHADRGTAGVWVTNDRIIVRVRDWGAGIKTEDLPATILMPGYSTKVSLGMGYTMMLALVDRVWLATGTEGTTVQLEKWLRVEDQPKQQLAPTLEGLPDKL